MRLSFEVAERHANAGGAAERARGRDALRDGDAAPGRLTLKRILQTVVDSFGVEEAADGYIVVRLEKVKGSP